MDIWTHIYAIRISVVLGFQLKKKTFLFKLSRFLQIFIWIFKNQLSSNKKAADMHGIKSVLYISVSSTYIIGFTAAINLRLSLRKFHIDFILQTPLKKINCTCFYFPIRSFLRRIQLANKMVFGVYKENY